MLVRSIAENPNGFRRLAAKHGIRPVGSLAGRAVQAVKMSQEFDGFDGDFQQMVGGCACYDGGVDFDGLTGEMESQGFDNFFDKIAGLAKKVLGGIGKVGKGIAKMVQKKRKAKRDKARKAKEAAEKAGKEKALEDMKAASTPPAGGAAGFLSTTKGKIAVGVGLLLVILLILYLTVWRKKG
jgi:hypothetical protein